MYWLLVLLASKDDCLGLLQKFLLYTTENIIPIDYVSMSVGHLVHVLLIGLCVMSVLIMFSLSRFLF